MIHYTFIRRQLTTARQQSIIFILCVALSIVTIVGLNSFGSSVNQALNSDARELMAGDATVDSSYALSQPVQDVIAQLAADGEAQATTIITLYTVAQVLTQDDSLLTELKIVEPAYPFYGEVKLASGRALRDVLQPGTIIVEQLILDRLGLHVGDALHVGQAVLTISDVELSEPDRPVNFFSFGPRILVAAADTERLDLIKPGSRVNYRTLLKVPDERNLEAVADKLDAAADPALERVSTFRTRQSGIQRFFNNLLYFLSLVAIFTLLLAGIGIQSAITAFLRERDNTVAIVKTVGADSRFVTRHFLYVIAILGAIGTLIGLAGGFGLERVFPLLLGRFLPPDVQITIQPLVVAESLLLGIVVVAIFTFLPLDRLKELRPSFILRKEETPTPRGLRFILSLLLLIIFFFGMAYWQIGTLRRSLYFVGSVLGLLLLTALVTEGVLWLLRRRRVKQLEIRQALRGLFRPRNATRAIIITLAAALAVLFTIYLVEQNLDAAFVSSYPDDAPNVFFLDIQPDQVDAFKALVEGETQTEIELFPVVRGLITSINNTPVDREQERARRGENLARQFNLTYRDHLLDSEALVAGRDLFDPNVAGAQVSVLDELAPLGNFKIGDVIAFRIQGVPLTATVTSVRTQTDENIGPFFNFVFRPQDLQNAPQSIFSALHMDAAAIPSLQNQVVAQFPNISVINATEAVASFAATARQLSQVVRFLMLFSLVAGVLIIVSSVYATRFARIQEAVYFKVLGAEGRFVLRVFALENLLLGLVSATIALGLAQISSWIVSTRVFEIRYAPLFGASAIMVIGTVALVMLVGLLASLPILRQRPIRFLREQTQE
ncbi:MAG: FtsX-like permease family protein [Caldilineaceae bacterium]